MPKVLIIPQPRFGVPAVNDGAAAIIIEDILTSLPVDAIAWSLSFWDEKIGALPYDKQRFHHIKRESFYFRFFRRIARFLKYQSSLADFSSLYTDYFLALHLEILRYQPDILVVHTTKMNWALAISTRFSKQKTLIYHHNSEAHLLDRNTILRLANEIDAHIFVADYARQSFEKKLASIASITEQPLLKTIHNGINVSAVIASHSREQERQKLGVSQDTFVLLFAGRLIERKGLHKILDAFEILESDILSKITLLIIGAEDYFGKTNSSYITALKNRAMTGRFREHIHFLNYIPHREMHRYYAASDLLLFPSIELEGHPLSLLEAQACGVPVIASNVGGANETLIAEETGFLLDPPGDPNQIAYYIDLLYRNPILRTQMGDQAARHIQRNFSRERMASEFWHFMQILTDL